MIKCVRGSDFTENSKQICLTPKKGEASMERNITLRHFSEVKKSFLAKCHVSFAFFNITWRECVTSVLHNDYNVT